ncbi:RES domain-containing protein [Dickeya dadantii]|nr:RES domain-containing protein [Dickeya dadantii]
MNFKSFRSYWDFKYSVDNKQRYILDKESTDFLNSIIDTCRDREISLKKDSIFWRAQNGHNWRLYYQYDPKTDEEIYVDDVPTPFPKVRMKPLADSAAEGRANSKGIPCLYVATDKETAMSEVRPWLGAILSVAQLRLTRDLRVLDFSVEQGKYHLHLDSQEPTQEKITQAVWSDIDNAFSKPTKDSELKSEYAPTQIISEFIKSKGYDGIAYKSALAEGHNICLFDLESADVINCSIYESIKINFNFNRLEEY